MGIFWSEPVKPPQHFFQIVSYIQNIVDGVADNGFARNLLRIGRAVVAKIGKSRTYITIFDTTFELWLLVALIRIAYRCIIITKGKLIQTSRKHIC